MMTVSYVCFCMNALEMMGKANSFRVGAGCLGKDMPVCHTQIDDLGALLHKGS